MKIAKQLFLAMCLVVSCLILGNITLMRIGYCENAVRFEYNQKPITKVKKKNVKIRVAVSRFDEDVVIKDSPFNIEDAGGGKDDGALVKIIDSEVDIVIDEEEEEEEISKAESLTGLLISALQTTDLFNLVERKEVNELIREVNFQSSKWVENTGVNSLGNIYDVQYIVNGDILRNKDGEKIDGDYYTLTLRMYNVNTGMILSSSVSTSSYLKHAIDKAVADLAEQIKGKPWTCRVVGIGDGTIHINAGLRDDLEERDVFYVYRVEGEIVDPKTKEVLGINKKRIALIEVEEVLDNKLSRVKTIESYDGIRIGDIVSAERIDEEKESELELWRKIYKGRSVSTEEISKYSLTLPSSSPEDIMANFGKAVVKIQTGTVMGSGFIVSVDGYIITNFHIVQNATSVTAKMIERNQYFTDVQVVKVNPERDIALLKINNVNNLPIVTLGDSDNLTIGERVVAIGNPQGLENTVSDGLISGVREANGIKLIQTSAPITHGSSGGPLFNMKGEVVGVVTAGIEKEGNLNFAVPVNYVKKELLNF